MQLVNHCTDPNHILSQDPFFEFPFDSKVVHFLTFRNGFLQALSPFGGVSRRVLPEEREEKNSPLKLPNLVGSFQKATTSGYGLTGRMGLGMQAGLMIALSASSSACSPDCRLSMRGAPHLALMMLMAFPSVIRELPASI